MLCIQGVVYYLVLKCSFVRNCSFGKTVLNVHYIHVFVLSLGTFIYYRTSFVWHMGNTWIIASFFDWHISVT